MNSKQLPWPDGIWETIRHAVRAETERIGISPRFLPLFQATVDARTVPANRFEQNRSGALIEEAPTLPLVETWVDFSLTPQQILDEPHLKTCRTLSVRAANLLAQARDALNFQGEVAVDVHPLFTESRVAYRSGPVRSGLLDAAPDEHILEIRPLAEDPLRFGDRTYEAVAEAYTRLQALGHHGPYAVVLPTRVYTDAFAPLPITQIMPADRIKGLLGKRFYGTQTLPGLTGLLVSLGGNSLELVVGREPDPDYLRQDIDGNYCFRLRQRHSPRISDPTAIFRLEFGAESSSGEVDHENEH